MKKIKLLLLISMIVGASSLVSERFTETQSFLWREFHGIECIAFAVHFFATLWLVFTSRKSNLLLTLTGTSLIQLLTNPWEDMYPWSMVHNVSVLLSFIFTTVVFFRSK
jgi:hypothetical protein